MYAHISKNHLVGIFSDQHDNQKKAKPAVCAGQSIMELVMDHCPSIILFIILSMTQMPYPTVVYFSSHLYLFVIICNL